MATDAEVLENMLRAFADCERPEHFTDYTHCCECSEHDEVLRSRDRDTLRHDDVGNGAWDPMCFVTPEGFRYYLPALARLALEDPDPKWGWYGPQLLFHLSYDGPGNVRVTACSPEQRSAVRDLLGHILDTRAALADHNMCSHELLAAIACWPD